MSSDSTLALPRRAADAVKALALCRAGAIDEGLALYKELIRAADEQGDAIEFPIGLHLTFLAGMGLNAAADAVRAEALKAGRNVCVSAALKKPAREVAEEYRRLFAQGVTNSKMIADFLVQLSALGETNELASYLDVSRLVRRERLFTDGAKSEQRSFWEHVATTILQERRPDNWQEAVQSVRKMHFVSLGENQDIRIQRLLTEVRQRATRFVAELRAGDGPPLAWLPSSGFGLVSWAVISTGDGFNVPHIHHMGAISGVVYVAGPSDVRPDGEPVGALRIGPDRRVANAAGWPNLTIAPEPGTLIMMPSYFTHWTVPMAKPGRRISVAFDIADPRE